MCIFEVEHREDSLLVDTIVHVDNDITSRHYHRAALGGNIKIVALGIPEDLDFLM
jgi:hypothetical protein